MRPAPRSRAPIAPGPTGAALRALRGPATRLKPSQVRAQSSGTPMRRGRLPAFRCRHPHHAAGPERPGARNPDPSGITPSTITSPTGRPAGSRTEISPGARAHHDHVPNQPHAPPASRASSRQDDPALDMRGPTQISASERVQARPRQPKCRVPYRVRQHISSGSPLEPTIGFKCADRATASRGHESGPGASSARRRAAVRAAYAAGADGAHDPLGGGRRTAACQAPFAGDDGGHGVGVSLRLGRLHAASSTMRAMRDR